MRNLREAMANSDSDTNSLNAVIMIKMKQMMLTVLIQNKLFNDHLRETVSELSDLPSFF